MVAERIETEPAVQVEPEQQDYDPTAWYGVVDGYVAAVQARYGVTRALLFGRGREQSVIPARQLLCYLLLRSGGATCMVAGAILGRDHSTVLYGDGRTAKRCAADDDLAEYVAQVHAVTQARYGGVALPLVPSDPTIAAWQTARLGAPLTQPRGRTGRQTQTPTQPAPIQPTPATQPVVNHRKLAHPATVARRLVVRETVRPSAQMPWEPEMVQWTPGPLDLYWAKRRRQWAQECYRRP